MEYKLNKREIQHIMWIMEERGVGHCKFCKDLIKKLNKYQQANLEAPKGKGCNKHILYSSPPKRCGWQGLCDECKIADKGEEDGE